MPVQETKDRLFRHCEGRRPVAIQTAFQLALAFRMTEAPHGLPRRFAPRNDEVGDGTEVVPESRSQVSLWLMVFFIFFELQGENGWDFAR
jgi:hypothetical protein